MIQRTKAEIDAFCHKVWPDNDWVSAKDGVKVEVTDVNDGGLKIEVSRRHASLDLTFRHLCRVSEFFGTEAINDDTWHYGGCDTCDYGSTHGFTLWVYPDEVGA